jgi:hypothetical protein
MRQPRRLTQTEARLENDRLVDTTVDGVAIDDTAASVLSGSLVRAQAGTVAGEHVGDFAMTEGKLNAASDSKMSFTGGTLTISSASLTVPANPQTKVYGTADPSLTDGVTGLVDTTMDGVTIADTAASVLTGLLAHRAHRLPWHRPPAERLRGPYAISQGTLAAGHRRLFDTETDLSAARGGTCRTSLTSARRDPMPKPQASAIP